MRYKCVTVIWQKRWNQYIGFNITINRVYHSVYYMKYTLEETWYQGHLLLTWFNLNPSMDQLHLLQSVGLIYLSTLGLKLIHVSKRGHCCLHICSFLNHILWTWWRHDMETRSALLAIRGENPPVTTHKGSEMWSFVLSLFLARTSSWTCSPVASDLRRPCDVMVNTKIAASRNKLIGDPVNLFWLEPKVGQLRRASRR